jgi:hypothetical protein
MPHWVFVWRIDDLITLAVVAIVLIFGLLFLGLVVADKIQRKWRAFWKR